MGNQRKQFANYAEKMVDRQQQMRQRYKEHFEKEVARFKHAYTVLQAKNKELREKLANVDSSAAPSSTSESEHFGFKMPLTASEPNLSISSPITDSTETFTDSMQDFESGSFVSAVNSPEYLALKAQAKKLTTSVGKQ